MIMQGSAMDFDALVFGQPHPSTLQFMQQSIQNATQMASDASRGFFQQAAQVYDNFNGSEAMRLARAALRKANNIFTADDIRPLVDLGAIQNAREKMRRFIMADPVVRNMWQNQQIEGYADYYVDSEPGMVGDTHTDYAMVMQGIVVTEPDEPSHYNVFYGVEHPDELPLDIDQQADILSTWDRVRYLIDKGKDDPTSVWGSML